MAMQTFDEDELSDVKPQQASASAAAAAVAHSPEPGPIQKPERVSPQSPTQRPTPPSIPLPGPLPTTRTKVTAGDDFDEEPTRTQAASDEDDLDTDFDDERIYRQANQLDQCRPDKNLKAVRFSFVPLEWIKPKSANTHFVTTGTGKDTKKARYRCLVPITSDAMGTCCTGLEKKGDPKPNGEINIIGLVIRYLNANAEGKYKPAADGSVPPIEWALQFVRLTQYNMRSIRKLPDEDSNPFEIDIIMSTADGRAFGYDFSRASTTARWKKNPELVAEIKAAAMRFADGKALVRQLGKKLTEMEWKALLSGNVGGDESKLDNMDEL